MGQVSRVDDDAWISQPDAAQLLGVTVIRIGALIACGHLAPAENSAGQAGVTTASVRTETEWRQTAPIRAKLTLLIKDTINFV
jgi:hypothetical protein